MVRSFGSARRPGALLLAIIGATSVGGGIALLILGWWRISGEALVARQLPYLASASIPGATLVIGGTVLVGMWLRAGTAERVDRLYRLLTEVETPATVDRVGTPSPMNDPRVTVAGTSRYHRTDCALVSGKSVGVVSDPRASTPPLDPCPICLPDA